MSAATPSCFLVADGGLREKSEKTARAALAVQPQSQWSRTSGSCRARQACACVSPTLVLMTPTPGRKPQPFAPSRAPREAGGAPASTEY